MHSCKEGTMHARTLTALHSCLCACVHYYVLVRSRRPGAVRGLRPGELCERAAAVRAAAAAVRPAGQHLSTNSYAVPAAQATVAAPSPGHERAVPEHGDPVA